MKKEISGDRLPDPGEVMFRDYAGKNKGVYVQRACEMHRIRGAKRIS